MARAKAKKAALLYFCFVCGVFSLWSAKISFRTQFSIEIIFLQEKGCEVNYFKNKRNTCSDAS